MSIYRNYKYEIQWVSNVIKNMTKPDEYDEFCKQFSNELDAVKYALDYMVINRIDSYNLMYCRVEEVFDSEMRANVLLWIGE